MENNTTTTTTTVVETETKKEELKVTKKEKEIILPPLFLKFAEYLGYETPLIDYVDKYCDGKEIPEIMLKALCIDAVSVFKKMKKEYTEEEIREWYDMFYPVVIKECEDKILERISKDTDDLPF